MFEKKEQREEGSKIPDSLKNLRDSLTVTPVLAFVEKFDNFFKKKYRALTTGEILFSPGEDPHFYIIAAGSLRIFHINPSGEKKEVGIATRGSFLGEWVISDRTLKEVEAVSDADHTMVIFVTKEELEYLESIDPETLAKLYKHIMNTTSQRLAAVNKELATLSELTQKVNDYKEAGEKGLQDAIMHLKTLLALDYVTLIEEHPAVPWMLVYKYTTEFQKPLKQPVGPEISLEEEGQKLSSGEIPYTEAGDRIHFIRLQNGGDFAGYLLLWRKKGNRWFSLAELRVSANLAPHFTSMLLNSQKLSEERALAMRDNIDV